MPNVTARVRFGDRVLSRAHRLTAGSSVDVIAEFRDDDGALVDVSGVTLTATRPGGAAYTWSEGTLEEVSAGIWRRRLTPPDTETGHWLIEAACTDPQPETAAAYVHLLAPGDLSLAGAPVPEPPTGTLSTGISDSTDIGRALLTAQSAGAVFEALGVTTPNAPAVLTWVGNTSPLPPQAFDADAGDPTLTEQQSILSDWLLACQEDARAAYLPTGVYRLSGAAQIDAITRAPIVLFGDGPRRSIIWMDDTYSGGAALRFDDVWWGATEVALPANLQPVQADGYVAGAPPLTTGQSFRAGLRLTDFSVIGQTTSLTTKAWLDGSLGQRGIDFDRRLDNAYLGKIAFANIQGQAMRFRPDTANTVGPRETTIELIETRQCGWGTTMPVIDILNDRAEAGGSDQVTMRRIKCANNHGPSLRVQHNGGAGSSSFNHWLIDDFLVHGEGSWNPEGIGYDAAIPLPGNAPWHHIEFLGAIDSMRAINIRTGHNIKGRGGDPDAFCIYVAAANGMVPNGLLLQAQNRDSGEKFILIEACAGARCEISSAEGGLVEVGAGVTGPVEILPPAGEELNLTVAAAARDLVVIGEHDPSGTLPLRAPAHVSRVQQGLGSAKTYRIDEIILAARTSASNPVSGFTALKDASVGVVGGEAQTAQPVRVPTGSLSLLVYRVHGNSAATQRAEWTGVVLVQRLTDEASTTILAGPGASAAPTSSSGATGDAARLAVAANTSAGGVDFAMTWSGSADHTLHVEQITLSQVVSGNLTHMQAALMRRAAPILAGLSDPTLSGPYADDAAAISGGVGFGQKYLTSSGQIATMSTVTTPSVVQEFLLTGATTGATPLRLSTDGGATLTAATMGEIPSHARVRLTGEVVAVQTGGAAGARGDSAQWTVDLVAYRGSGAGTITHQLGALASAAPTFSNGGASAWSLTLSFDTTGTYAGLLRCEFTGEASKNIMIRANLTQTVVDG